MCELEEKFQWLASDHQYITLTDQKDKVMAFERGDLLFIFNWHHTKSYTDYRIGSKWGSEHVIVLESDQADFFGLDRFKVAKNMYFPIIKEGWKGRPNYFHIYLPTRTAIVMCAEENLEKYGLE